jgi:hypothetical protein
MLALPALRKTWQDAGVGYQDEWQRAGGGIKDFRAGGGLEDLCGY